MGLLILYTFLIDTKMINFVIFGKIIKKKIIRENIVEMINFKQNIYK